MLGVAGHVLVKKYDKTLRVVVSGKWLLFDGDGACIGQNNFRNQPASAPPLEWADQQIRNQNFLKSQGF